MNSRNKAIYDMAINMAKIYGKEAVEGFFAEKRWDYWPLCDSCKAETPHIEDSDDFASTCLVCGAVTSDR